MPDKYSEIFSELHKFHVLDNGDLNTIINEATKIMSQHYVGSKIFSEEITEKLDLEIFEGYDIEFLEHKAEITIEPKPPHSILTELNILAVDGSSLIFKGHPVRIIIARSGVFSHSQRLTNVLRLTGNPLSTLRIIDEYENYIDLEDVLRRYESETLSFIESQTIIEISEALEPNQVDFIFHDGPLYFPNGFEYTYRMSEELYQKGIPIIGIVKNSYSRTIMDKLGLRGYLDSDFFAYYLEPGKRSPFFVNENPTFNIDNEDLKTVSCYYMTPARTLLRIDVPYWVFEDYGAERIMDVVAADIALGSGKHSYFIKMADRKAKFTEYERKKLLRELEELIFRAGYNEKSFYNHKRWGFLR